MRHPKRFIVLDLGGSARCVVGSFDGEALTLEVITRFTNPYVRILDQVYWDVLALFDQVKRSLRQVVTRYGTTELAGLGVDAMGGAFALLDRQGALLGNPLYSRLPQQANILEEAFKRVEPARIYQQTGLMPTKLKALYGLLAMQMTGSPQLEAADNLLMLPDLINYWLTGRVASEYTIASTSYLLDARTRSWAYSLLDAMRLPTDILPELVEPGQILADLHPSVMTEIGLPPLPVIATAAHDTAAAVAAVPVLQPHWAYLSSGTWGMVGVELDAPILSPEAQACQFGNEGGVGGTIRFISNNLNMWLLQECKRVWGEQGQVYSWQELMSLAEGSEPHLAVIDPNAKRFFMPDHMPLAIQAYCADTGQVVPRTPGQITRVILESLALRYRDAIAKLSQVTGKRVEVLHIVGGGGRNHLLNQWTASACELPVIVGPFEATAVGNIIMQMIALGELADLSDGRALVHLSFATDFYSPSAGTEWGNYYRY